LLISMQEWNRTSVLFCWFSDSPR